MQYQQRTPHKPQTSLYIEIRYKGLKHRFYPGISIPVKHWSQTRQTVLALNKDYQKLNKQLLDYENRLKDAKLNLQPKDVVTRAMIDAEMRLLLDGTVATDQDLIGYLDAIVREKNGKSNQRTWKNLKTTVEECFANPKRIEFSEIDLAWIQLFHKYLLEYKYEEEKGVFVHYSNNTIDKHMTNIKSVIRKCITKKLIVPFDLKDIKTAAHDVDTVFTDLTQLRKMLDAKDLEGNEVVVRDLYVANCFLALRISDLSSVEPTEFNTRTFKDSPHLIYNGWQKKTKAKIEFPVHPVAAEIFKKYSYTFPKISEGEFNRVIKMVALKAGLTHTVKIKEVRGNKVESFKKVPFYTQISTHTARRSFCTILYHKGYSMRAIMSVSGHKSEKEFLKYINKGTGVGIQLQIKMMSKINL